MAITSISMGNETKTHRQQGFQMQCNAMREWVRQSVIFQDLETFESIAFIGPRISINFRLSTLERDWDSKKLAYYRSPSATAAAAGGNPPFSFLEMEMEMEMECVKLPLLFLLLLLLPLARASDNHLSPKGVNFEGTRTRLVGSLLFLVALLWEKAQLFPVIFHGLLLLLLLLLGLRFWFCICSGCFDVCEDQVERCGSCAWWMGC